MGKLDNITIANVAKAALAYVMLNEERPEWLQDAIYAAHELTDSLPDDFIYETTHTIFALIADGDIKTEDDIYTHDLTATSSRELFDWALNFSEYVDEAARNGLIDAKATLYDRVSFGQTQHIEDIAHVIFRACENELERLQNEAEDEDEV